MAGKTKSKPKAKGVANLIKKFLKRESPLKKNVQPVLVSKKEHFSEKSPEKKPATAKKTDIKPVCFDPEISRKMAASNDHLLSKKRKNKENYSFLSPRTIIVGPKYFFHTDIPDTYNETYMRAIPRDPEWIFVYWEISEPTMNDLKRKMGGTEFGIAKKLLRLCDVTEIIYNGSNAWRYTDIEINRIANNWYIKVPEPSRTYLVECGFLTSDGRFLLAVRSNVVKVPRLGLSPVLDQQWSTAASDELIRMSAAGIKRGLGASEKRFGVLAGEAGNQEAFWGLSAGSGSGLFGVPGSGTR
jgi:hypothetical protein